MRSTKFFLATPLQKVASALFLMRVNTLATPKSIASAKNSFFASTGKRLAVKITATWPSCHLSADLPKSRFQLADLEKSLVLQ